MCLGLDEPKPTFCRVPISSTFGVIVGTCKKACYKVGLEVLKEGSRSQGLRAFGGFRESLLNWGCGLHVWNLGFRASGPRGWALSFGVLGFGASGFRGVGVCCIEGLGECR